MSYFVNYSASRQKKACANYIFALESPEAKKKNRNLSKDKALVLRFEDKIKTLRGPIGHSDMKVHKVNY